ncbi:ATP-binding protein [Actinoplanes friuliensis]|uniref:Histidine kinase n=1 Tax=Actinoplanes friuliensis DSM 7358 TaxID=1246995 RepID=U5W1P3_9ACTN|nr:ATP-binding protein [Actinoplanes friuliensis]AGZ42947.1 histidine kinase [Actinoplanes friuliensis DSM 7358]
MDSLRLSFAHRTDYAGLRQHAREVLDRWQTPDLVDDTLLVITELVENVVQHTGDGGELVLHRCGDAVRVEVADSSSALPRAYGPDPRRIGGRGLLLVAAVSRDWGARPDGVGKIVWADVPLTSQASARS